MTTYTPTTALERVVWDWLNESEDPMYPPEATYRDLMCGGCVSGIVGALIYYHDTLAFYVEHADAIDALLYEIMDGTGMQPGELFKDWDNEDPLGRKDHNRNLLAWFGFEETARQIANQLEWED